MARLAGTLGAVYAKISGTFTKIADVYDWEFHSSTKMLNCSIKGDNIERWVASHTEGTTFTAKRRHEGVNVFPFYVADAAQNGTQMTWRLDLIDNNSGFTQITCEGYASKSSTTVPQEGVEETFELQIDDAYSFNV